MSSFYLGIAYTGRSLGRIVVLVSEYIDRLRVASCIIDGRLKILRWLAVASQVSSLRLVSRMYVHALLRRLECGVRRLRRRFAMLFYFCVWRPSNYTPVE